MPRSAKTKVWNDDLLRAFRVRMEFSRANEKPYFKWEAAIDAIKAQRKDIYWQNSKDHGGRVVNKPALEKTAAALLDALIRGEAPIIPPGHEEFDVDDPNAAQRPLPSSDMSTHQYLKKMERRSGGYAILMVFHKEQLRRGPDFRGPLHKHQIIRLAQPFCNEEMAQDFFRDGGRTGGWRAMNSLEKYKLVQRDSNQWQRAQNGFQRGANQQDAFWLTDTGVKFLHEMLKKFEDFDNDAPNQGQGGAAAPGSSSKGAGGWGGASSYSSSPGGSSGRRGGYGGSGRGGNSAWFRAHSPFDDTEEDRQTFNKDEEDLDEKEFKKISKARRKKLHDLCSGPKQAEYGVELEHQSYNDGPSRRTLVVRIVSKGKKRAREEDDWQDGPGQHEHSFSSFGSSLHSADADIQAALRASSQSASAGIGIQQGVASNGAGHKLGRASGSKMKELMTPAQLAAQAAERRNQSLAKKARHQPSCPAPDKSRKLVEEFDSDSEDEDMKLAKALSLAESASHSKREDEDVVEIPESQEVEAVIDLQSQEEEKIIIDVQSQDTSNVHRASTFVLSDSDDSVILGEEDSKAVARRQSRGKTLPPDNAARARTHGLAASKAGAPAPSAQASASKLCVVNGQARILVDTTERKKNNDPREIVRRLGALVHENNAVASSSVVTTAHGGGKRILDKRDVEQKKLCMGDFTTVLVEEDEEGAGERERVLMMVERKTINDLCGRSATGDHLRQLSRMRGSGLQRGFLLLEGDAKDAPKATVWGIKSWQADNTLFGKASGSSVVQDCEDYMELLAWLVLTDRSLAGRGPGTVRVLQAKSMEQSLHLLVAMSICLAFEACGAILGQPPPACGWDEEKEQEMLLSDTQKFLSKVKKAEKDLAKTLQEHDVPSKAASQIVDRFGSLPILEAALESCRSDYHRSKLLVDVADLSACAAQDARDAVLKLLAPAALSGAARSGDAIRASDGARKTGPNDENSDDDVVDLTELQPPRTSGAHDGRGGGGTVQGECWRDRVAHIEASPRMLRVLLPTAADKEELARTETLRLKEWSGSREVPALWMVVKTINKDRGASQALPLRTSHRESLPVRLTVLKGPEVVRCILTSARSADCSGPHSASIPDENRPFSWQFRAAASAATKLIAEACDTAFDDAIESLPRILVLEGLERARKAEERMNGTSQREVRELHLLCDMLVSCLLLSHPTVTVWKSQNEEETRHYAFALARVCRSQALLVV